MFELPQEVKEGIKGYRDAVKDAQEGKISLARLKGMRVPWGVYSHRGGAIFMTRIRIVAGVVTPLQLKALAQASTKYGDGILHITTRQDIQIHNVKLKDTTDVLEYLKDYALSPRGGGGNTIRNIIACPLAGVCSEEAFDVRKHAIALTEHLLRQDSSFDLPRKFKIAFSGCAKDCTGVLINDLGFLAKSENGKRGFKVFVGGGLGAHSRIGRLLEGFIPEEDMPYCVSAVKNIFYSKGDRRNKHHNRLRFLIEDIGFEEFKKLYDKEFNRLKETEYISLRKVAFAKRKGSHASIPQAGEKDYKEFLKYNVQAQRQKGFASIQLRIPRGDIRAEALSVLADLEKEFGRIEFRTSQNQNLFITWVKNEDVHKLFLKLKEILKDFLYPQTLLDVVACKGALTCNLGLCNSPGLAKEIENVIKENFIGKKVFDRLNIKLNGCPNACGHQPVGEISFYGVVKRVDNRPVPFYKILLGGRKEAGLTRLARDVGLIPAKNIPEFLKDFLQKADKRIDTDTDIYKFLEKDAIDIAKEVLKDYSYVPAYSQDRTFYIDWGRSNEFSLAGLGPGECGAGVLDMIDSDLTEAKLALEEAEKENFAPEAIKKALLLSGRALLIIKGRDPKSEEAVFSDFKAKFIDEGIASDEYSGIANIFKEIDDKLSPEARKDKFSYAKKFFNHINELYKKMDAAFNFPKGETTSKEKGASSGMLDLKGTPCPLNYVKTKLFLENLKPGDTVEVLLDEGEPIENVPKSLKEDGHQVVRIDKQDGFYKVLVKKK